MTAMSVKYFDTLEYVRKAKELKDPEALAEYQVKQIETAIETAVNQIESKDLATKKDLELEISRLEHRLLKAIIWTGAISTSVILSLLGGIGGMVAHGFHWI